MAELDHAAPMSFRRGASLRTIDTLGYADSADLGPTAGNGFRTRWPDDLATLLEFGIDDITLTLDWARLQPKPDVIDADWAERFEQVLHAADAIGLGVIACLHDGSIPRWFDNEGGLDNGEAFVRWWPRWVERAADRFGDIVAAWAPFARIPDDLPAAPSTTGPQLGARRTSLTAAPSPSAATHLAWRDTWGILGGGGAPVIATLELGDRRPSIGAYVGQMDQVGVVLDTAWEADDEVTSAAIDEAADRWGGALRDAFDVTDRLPVQIVGFHPGHRDWATSAAIVEALVSAVDAAIDDGVQIISCSLDPAIAGSDSLPGLLDHDRSPTDGAAAFLAGSDPGD